MKPSKARVARKKVLSRYADITCPLCVEAVRRPRHLALTSVVTEALEVIAKSLADTESRFMPGVGRHRRTEGVDQ